MNERLSLPQKTADAVMEALMNSDRYSPGDRLPCENELSEKYGVSRSTLREAVKILAARGIVEIRRGTGTFVTAIPQGRDMALPDLRKTRMELRDLYEVRLMFEPKAAAIACVRATDAELEEITLLSRLVERLSAAGEDSTEADIDFHVAIVRATHNEFIGVMIPLVQQAMSDRRFLLAEGGSAATYLPDHDIITQFLCQRDQTGAQAAALMHLRRMAAALGMSTDGPL